MALRSLHKRTVDEILPEFAERLKKEGVISAYDHQKQLRIRLVKDSQPIKIIPDLTLSLLGRGKVVVEVVNPDKAKRFIGEIVYPHILGNLGMIEAAIFFVLPTPKSRKCERAMIQEMTLHLFFEKQLPFIVIYLDTNKPEETYYILHDSLIDYQRLGKFY